MSRPRFIAKCCYLVCAIALLCPALWGQASGEIAGKVADATGAFVPGVEVTATHVATGTTRNAITSDSGIYRISFLQSGLYNVKAVLTGFKTAVREGITLTVGQVVAVDLVLEVGAISETVTVSGEASPVNTEQGRVSSLVDAKRIVDLPLNGRNIYQLMQIAPGVTNTAATVTEPGQGVSVNGGRVNFNGFWLDGVSAKGLSGGTAGNSTFAPNVDSVQEFRMETLNFSAEFGNASGSVVNVVSKAGTNNFHGTLYEFHRNDNLDAREFFDADKKDAAGNIIQKGKPEFKQNQFGGTIGGPIRKNSTFFFGSYEGLTIRTGNSANETFESPQWASFVQRAVPRSVAAFLYKNYPAPRISSTTETVGQYLGLNGLGHINSASPTQAQVDSFLRGEFGSGATAGSLLVNDPMIGETSFFTPDASDGHQWSIRFDQELRGGKDKVFGRYYGHKLEGAVVDARPAFNSPTDSKAYQFSLAETHIFSPKVVNEFRAGLNRGIGDVGAGTPGVPLVAEGAHGVAPFGAYNGYPQSFHENIFNYSDVLSISKGNHGMKVGVEFRRNQENSEFNVGRPSYNFFDLVYLALDDPYYQVGGVDPHIADGTRRAELKSNFRGWRNSEVGIFFNDDWKIRPNLTINLGVRFDLYTRLTEVNGRTTKYDMSKGTNLFDSLRKGDFAATDSLSAGDHNNFAPRIGFAWDPGGKGKMSVRGGFGIAFQSGIYNPLANSRWNPPYYSFNLICDVCGRPRETILYGPQRGQPVSATGANPNIGAGSFEGNIIAYEPTNNNSTFLTGIANPNMRDPYVMSWFVGIQREIFRDLTFEVNYVGTGGRKLIRAENFNRFPGDRLGLANPNGEFAGMTGVNRIQPLYGRMRFWENSVNSSYNSLQVQIMKRFSKGYSVTTNYTLSKSLDIRSTWHSGATTSNAQQEGFSTDVLNQRLDYGRSIFDARHRFVTSFVWELPFFRTSRALLQNILGGWQINGIVALQSGQPFTPFTTQSFPAGGDFNADAENNDRPNAPSTGNTVTSERSSWVNPLAGPFKIPIANPSRCPQPPAQCFPNTADKFLFFTKPTPGTNGNLGRNTFEGPGFANTDLSLFKNFKITPLGEETKLQFRFELFNIFNRVNFLQPTPQINVTTFGRSTATFDARQIQLALKIIF